MKKLLGIMLLTGALAFSGCGEHTDIDLSTLVSAPVCADDAYATNSNTQLVVAAANGVLANDSRNGAGITYDGTSANGGTIVGASDGSFTYTPATNFAGTDTFAYTLSSAAGSVTCTVTITVTAVNGYFVDAALGSDATGSFTNGLPYATIQAALADAPAGSDIVVRPGSYTGTVTLDNGDRLLGSGSVLAQGVVRPTLTGPVVMADGCTLDYLRIDGTTSNAVDGDGQNGGTVTNCEIANITGALSSAVALDGAFGSWNVSSNSMSSIGSIALAVRTTGASSLTIVADNNSITNAQGAMGFVSESTATVNASVKGNTFTSSGPGGGSAFELTCGGDSMFCLDLENNTNDDTYAFLDSNLGTAVLSIEEFSVLTQPQPGGAGNTGTVDDGTGIGGDTPTAVADGTCGF